MGNVTMPSGALVVSGIVLVVIGLLVAGNMVIVSLGIVSLIAAGLLQVLVARRA